MNAQAITLYNEFENQISKSKSLPDEDGPYFARVNELTHCGLVTSYGGRDLGQDWLR